MNDSIATLSDTDYEMNHQAMDWVLLNSTATGTARFVLSLIASFSDGKAQAEPSIETIADLAGLSARGVEKILSHLSDEGELSWETGKGRTNKTNLYTLPLLPDYRPLGQVK
jgi:pyocin large subunit-like protein